MEIIQVQYKVPHQVGRSFSSQTLILRNAIDMLSVRINSNCLMVELIDSSLSIDYSPQFGL